MVCPGRQAGAVLREWAHRRVGPAEGRAAAALPQARVRDGQVERVNGMPRAPGWCCSVNGPIAGWVPHKGVLLLQPFHKPERGTDR